MGGDWYDAAAYYACTIKVPRYTSKFRYAMELSKRITSPHDNITIKTVYESVHDRMYMNEGIDQDMVSVIFGFVVSGLTAVKFNELASALHTFIKDADFKGKENFEEPTFLTVMEHLDYNQISKDEEDSDDDDDSAAAPAPTDK
jgi:hypothetical protein